MKLKITIIATMIIIIALLITTTISNAIDLKNEEIKILKNEIDDLYEQLAESNSKVAKYESIVDAINNIDLNKNEYTYYPIENLTISEQEFIYDIAVANNLSYELLLSILKVESGFDKEAVSETQDFGISQIHKPYASYWAFVANLEEYDLFDFKDNIKMAVANLATCREYWLEQYPDISDEVLVFYMLGSYNRGLAGFTKYCKENNTYITNYAQIVLNYKMQLEQK